MKSNTAHALMLTAVTVMCAVSTLASASDSDDATAAMLKKTYVYSTDLKDDSVSVAVKDGVVTLTGTVADDAHKKLAQITAENLEGISRVENQLTMQAEDSAESGDTRIGRMLKYALLFNDSLSSGKTTIDVQDGVVTLRGEASSASQKDLTGEYAKDIEGVNAVKNEMTVATHQQRMARTAGEKRDDASITAKVTLAFTYHHSIHTLGTKVKTRYGVVTVTGFADNAAEKALVSKLASDIAGVSSVNNEMTIKTAATK